jgi:hypothetical protein
MPPATIAFDTDRELVRKVSNGLLIAFAERDMRVLLFPQFCPEAEDEVGELVILRAQPRVGLVGEDGIQQHQPLDHATERRGLACRESRASFGRA